MDDSILIQKINDGDRSAIRLLVEKHKNLIWHIIIAMTGRNSDSEDLFQEIFLGVFKGIKTFRAEASLSTWIGSIAHHVCVDYLRKKKKETVIQSMDADQQWVLNLPTEVNWKQPENEDLNRLILAVIKKLPTEYRTVITLNHLDDRSYKDIAEITGMPVGTVKSYISRGRELLRKLLISNIPDLAEILENF